MKLNFKIIHLKKRFPLAISRGIRRDSYNLFVEYVKDGHSGWGEVSPGKNENAETPQIAQSEIQRLMDSGIENLSIEEIYAKGRLLEIAPCALAGLDIALWDWKAKKAGMPLYVLLGLPKPKVFTSVTIGINTPAVVKERVPLLLDGTTIKALKIKLGSPEGIEADKEMYAQVIESTKNYNVKLRVDANGGWSVEEAKIMMNWLAERKADYIEQPLKEGDEENLKYLFKNRPLPIYLDESCRFSQDIPKWAVSVDGVNLKLMKCGGITEAMRIIATAKSFGLKTMIGCMSESSISIAAAASISGIIDHIDLDSHYNLNPDPATGAIMVDGITMPTDFPGHGATLKPEFNAETTP
jgi:muconate cycloisomerase